MNRLLAALIVIFTGACASTETAVKDDSINDGLTPAFDVFRNRDGVLLMSSLTTGNEIVAGKGGRKSFVAVSQDRNRVALAIANSDSSHLYVFDRAARKATLLHSGFSGLVYSGNWSADGEIFYFGYYRPEGKRMGRGDLQYYSYQAHSVEGLGCSASRVVLAVMKDGSLLVRNSDNIFQVAADGCATLRTVDARKLYHVNVSPDGSHMSYVLRDLVFNQSTRQYEPDSTLYLESTTGSDPVKVVGDKYQPRNMNWSPDGSEIAFDVELQDGSGRRAISVYSLESGSSSYLVPPSRGSASSSHPVFSPNGAHILFVSTTDSGGTEVMWRTTGDSFTHVLDAAPVSTSWIDDDVLLLSFADGSSDFINVSSGSGTVILKSGRAYIHALASN